MEEDNMEGMDTEGLSLMNEAGKQFSVEKLGADQDMLEEIMITDHEESKAVDFERLIELTNDSEKGSSQLAYLVKNWEYRRANAVRLLREELDNLSKQTQEVELNLSKQKKEVELKKLEILEEHCFEKKDYADDKPPLSALDEVSDILPEISLKIKDAKNKGPEIEAEYDTLIYWKQRARHMEELWDVSIQREQTLIKELQESINNLERQPPPVEELCQILKRADHYLHFILQTAPVVMGHQDKDLRYRFIYNPHPGLDEEEIIGKTDVEIFAGAEELQEFKREVLERKLPAKREFTFETELFGSKTFLMYVEPVFSKAGDAIGVNYMGMDVTDQVKKREKMAKLREEIAVQKARETELNKRSFT